MDRRGFLGVASAAGAAGLAAEASSAALAETLSGAAQVQPGLPRSYGAWEVGDQRSLDSLRRVTRRMVVPGVGQTLVKVSHAALAARDLGIASSRFLGAKRPDLIPLSEGAGTVVAIGPGPSRVKLGDRVTAGHFGAWVDGPWSIEYYKADIGNEIDGWLTEYALLPTSSLVVLPPGFSELHAAVLSGSGVTAWHALHEVARVRSGETVLTLGTGGVSTIGLQLAKLAGARVVVTSSSDAKLARMQALGADLTVNYRSDASWGETVFKATGGVDVVLENVGRETLDQSLTACGTNARVVMIGTGPLPKELPKMPGFYLKNVMMKAISNGSVRMLADLVTALARNRVEPVVDRVFEFAQAREAYRFFDESSHIGKVAIRI